MSVPGSAVAGFNWSRFNLQVIATNLVLTALAVVMFMAIHQFLADEVGMNSLASDISAPVERTIAESITAWIAALLATFRPGWVGWVIAIGGPLGAMLLAGQRLSALREAGGEGLAASLDTRRVDPTSGHPHSVLFEQVTAAAAARGMKAPPIHVLDLPQAVTAVTLGTTPADAVLIFSSGALHEDREELLRRLCAILDCPVSMLRPAATANQPASDTRSTALARPASVATATWRCDASCSPAARSSRTGPSRAWPCCWWAYSWSPCAATCIAARSAGSRSSSCVPPPC